MQTIRGVLGNAEVHVALSLVELKAIAYIAIGVCSGIPAGPITSQ